VVTKPTQSGTKTNGQESHRKRPNRGVILLTHKGLLDLQLAEVDCKTVGQKAVGLLTLPASWTLPFFVVASDVASAISDPAKLQTVLAHAAASARLKTDKVIIRSNAVTETIADRGTLASESAAWDDAANTLLRLQAKTQSQVEGEVHWIIQNVAVSYAQGQLSNERRVSRENRDWVLEVEKGMPQQTAQPIGVRAWRSGKNLNVVHLRCDSFLQISVALRQVAHWASQDNRRFLFEWIWDGGSVWIVQLDVATSGDGVKPASLLPTSVTLSAPEGLKVFRNASDSDFAGLRKLSNTQTYRSLGYTMPPFYVLDAGCGVSDFLAGGAISGDLLLDFEQLTKRSLVLRTDGSALPSDKREMLPRSEELRNVAEVVKWLTEEFRPKCIEFGLEIAPLSLIAHHFIPSVASAWARAEPGKRWVRIEALWGIPEGVYWHSHDTFQIDVESLDLSSGFRGDEYPSQSHLRYKGTFIAPDTSGAWVHHQTDQSADWKPSIEKSSWLSEIAYTTRQIAEKENAAVEVMWFVDTHRGACKHQVLPWYHSKPLSLDVPVGTPRRRKLTSSQDLTIRTQQDWLDLKALVQGGQRIERVLVEPRDSWLVRNLTFAEDLGSFSAENNIVVVLSGGILSHAFHVLGRKGAHVECVDLYGTNEERVEYNKVVRDKVPQHIASRGERYETVRLTGDALLMALRRKLVEEAFEALDASSGTDLLGELADLQEVVLAITKAVGSTVDDLETERVRKLKKRGGFDNGLMLQTTSSPRSLPVPRPIGPLVTEIAEDSIRVISNPVEIPVKARYRRPDRRVSGNSSEELLAVELELNRLEKETEAITYKLVEGSEVSELLVETELRRHGSDLRVVIKVRKKPGDDVPEQGKLKFDP